MGYDAFLCSCCISSCSLLIWAVVFVGRIPAGERAVVNGASATVSALTGFHPLRDPPTLAASQGMRRLSRPNGRSMHDGNDLAVV
ncbi:hypothetical protein [Yersinia enterocolitica]|uniref:hypothetical protein n=1 Tax=Yersinia enterocolitica TaxID=630 RepID=UPI001C60A910|nr:hypothetical protein [Yersinia enterocolitica]MBW5839977.1 hypothetical protein [Yersinia enterocolitica]MBW5866011.1 hypothetical protein [Yersinia enterocolitica]MBW5874659.1 hypothetical protein [Yersinia enterocolitica]